MSVKLFLSSAPLLAFALLASPTLAQNTASQPKLPGAGIKEAATAPFVLKEHVRQVVVDVVVEDSKGNHIRGLKAADFEIYEQTPSKGRDKRKQKIVKISEIETASMKPPAGAPANMPPGVYSNAVVVQKDPVPPTVLLVDGLNTEVQYQAQVHRQMLRMLKQIPRNVPVAVFLMGYRLTLLQGFTTDPQLLQKALAEAESVSGNGGHVNPQDDASAPGNQLSGLNPTSAIGTTVHPEAVLRMVMGLRRFDDIVYAMQLNQRFDRSYIAFLSIARSLEGYPGRKNVLWLSTSFPLTFEQFKQTYNDTAYVNNWGRMKVLNNVLSAANVAVYPVDVGGVRTLETFSAGTRPADPFAGGTTPVDGTRIADAEGREMETLNQEQDTMRSIASDTGGKVCTGSNDLGECIRKAMNDSSDFYEISYTPDSTDWNGEYRKILVKVKERGAHLSYREGYYATDDANPDPHVQEAELQKDCDVLLDATGIAFTARKLRPDTKGQLGFSLEIDSSNLTLTPISDQEHKMDMEVGVCTFDKHGWPQKVLAYPVHLGLDERAYNTVISGKVRDTIFVPGAEPAAVRVVVRDIPSGRVGSIYIPTATNIAVPSQSAQNAATLNVPR